MKMLTPLGRSEMAQWWEGEEPRSKRKGCAGEMQCGLGWEGE